MGVAVGMVGGCVGGWEWQAAGMGVAAVRVQLGLCRPAQQDLLRGRGLLVELVLHGGGEVGGALPRHDLGGVWQGVGVREVVVMVGGAVGVGVTRRVEQHRKLAPAAGQGSQGSFSLTGRTTLNNLTDQTH